VIAVSRPQDPVFLFDEDGDLFWTGDPGMAAEWLDDLEEGFVGFDALARPLTFSGTSDAISIDLASEEPCEADMRSALALYCRVHARGPRMPDIDDLQGFLGAVLNSLDDE
jgi:hypothetical protein